MVEPSKFHSNLDDSISSAEKSNLAYMSYAVHNFPCQQKNNTTPVSLENGEQVSNTNGRSQSTWKIHPSLEALLGDFCSEFDVNKKRHSINYPSTGGFPSPANSVKETNLPNGPSLGYKLSVAAPEFIPLTPEKMLSSFPRVNNPITANQLSNITLAEPESPPGLQIKDQSLMGKPHSTHGYVPSEMPSIKYSQNEHSSFRQPEERDLISFDPDATSRLFKRSPPSAERSESFKSNPGSLLSESGNSHASSSFETPYTPSAPKYGEIRPRQCTISPGQNLFDKSAEATPLSQSMHDQSETNNFQSAVEKLVEDPSSEEEQSPPPTHNPARRLEFKTYAEAANYFYSLLEEQSREELFELPSVHVPPPPPSPPVGSEHSFERPNWAVARNEGTDLTKMRQQYCSVSAPTSFRTATPREQHSSADRAYTADHPKPIISPVVREQQVSPLHSNVGNGYTEPILQEPRPLHSGMNRYNPEADDSRDNSDIYTPYSSSNKGGDEIKPYRKANNGGGPAAHDLEREIDGFHENLRAKANRANQISGQRSKSSRNGGGGFPRGGRGKRGRNSYKRYSNEEQGFDDPVVSGGDIGWGMDNNANSQWGMEPEGDGNSGPY